VFSRSRKLRRVDQAITPKIGPHRRIKPNASAQRTPSWKLATKILARNPQPMHVRRAKPILVLVVKGCFPKFAPESRFVLNRFWKHDDSLSSLNILRPSVVLAITHS
jgi:hypothetical protein